MKEKIVSASILALSIVILGFCLKSGIDNFVNKDNTVTVKGLSEKEVEADKVTWPILSKEVGDDLPQLYDKMGKTQTIIKKFLLVNGISESEISINAPSVIDMSANLYNNNPVPHRYNITSSITVTSQKVKLIRSIIAKQGSLLKNDVAIVDGGYENPIKYEFVAFNAMKPKMMQEAIANAETTAQQFAENSKSKLSKIVNASQGQFTIEDRDTNTPYLKKVRVVTTVTYALKH